MAIKIKVSDMLGKHKMTQKDLAQRTGIRPGTVSSLWHGNIKRLDIKHLNQLCYIFDCQPGDLLEYIPNKEESNEQ